MSKSNKTNIMKFPTICRDLRTQAKVTQREVATGIGVATSTVGNMECNNYKTVSLDRVHRLAKYHCLNPDLTADLVAAWNELPVSDYSAKQAKTWEKRKEFRGKARNHDRLKLALVEVCGILINEIPDPAHLCCCPDVDMFAGENPEPVQACELCNALQILGLTGFTNVRDVTDKLAKIQEAMTAPPQVTG